MTGTAQAGRVNRLVAPLRRGLFVYVPSERERYCPRASHVLKSRFLYGVELTLGWAGNLCRHICRILVHQRFHFNADATGLTKQPTQMGCEQDQGPVVVQRNCSILRRYRCYFPSPATSSA